MENMSWKTDKYDSGRMKTTEYKGRPDEVKQGEKVIAKVVSVALVEKKKRTDLRKCRTN